MNKLKERYISESEYAKKKDDTKVILQDWAYAICDSLEELTNEVRNARRRL